MKTSGAGWMAIPLVSREIDVFRSVGSEGSRLVGVEARLENLVEPETADESIRVLGSEDSFFEPDYIAEV